MIEANKNKIFESLFSLYNSRLLKKHFYAVYVSGLENFRRIKKEIPTIIYANHSNWWDGLAAFYLSKKILDIDAYVMMDFEQMQKYRFFKWIGAFSVNRDNPKEAMESLEYSVKLLQNSGRVLWIFPQGLMQPNDYRPVKFYSGTSKIAQRLGGVNLIPVSFRYEFLMEQRPEIFIGIGEPKILSSVESTKELTADLNNILVRELDALKSKINNSDFNSFKLILQGKKSRNKTIDKVYGK